MNYFDNECCTEMELILSKFQQLLMDNCSDCRHRRQTRLLTRNLDLRWMFSFSNIYNETEIGAFSGRMKILTRICGDVEE
ncbi:FAD-dependent monooxygenase pyvC [Dirofilaria immitis]